MRGRFIRPAKLRSNSHLVSSTISALGQKQIFAMSRSCPLHPPKADIDVLCRLGGEHWILQASLAQSISDELFVRSFASVLDASALAGGDLRGTGFVAGKIGSVGIASLTGFSRSNIPLFAHPARAKARNTANTHFIFPSCTVRHTFCRNMLSMRAVKEMDLRGRLLIG